MDFPKACPEYDREFMEKLKKMQSIVPNILLVLSTLLCFACFKYRKLAEVFIYLECLSCLMLFSQPKMSSSTNIEPMLMYLTYLFLVQAFAMHSLMHLGVATTCLAVQLLIASPKLYDRNSGPIDIFFMIVIIFIFFVHCCCGLVSIHYVSSLELQLNDENLAHSKVLSNFHEGLLILHETEEASAQILFCNKQAKEFVNQYILQQHKHANIVPPDELLAKAIFEPINENKNTELQKNQVATLRQIVQTQHNLQDQ